MYHFRQQDGKHCQSGTQIIYGTETVGLVRVVNELTGEQCPNSNVAESINFPGNPALTDIRAEAGITYEEILEKCVWMSPTEATVPKMAQIK